MNKKVLIPVGIVLGLCALCCCCLFSCFGLFSSNPEYRSQYCSEWVKQGNRISEEPFGWCR